jgi:hypothetical protein
MLQECTQCAHKQTCVCCLQVSLRDRTVRTLAGDGSKAPQDYVGGRVGRAQQLNSPWDVALSTQVRLTCHSI